MRRHKLAIQNNTITGRSFPEDVTPPGVPENLVCEENLTTNELILTWEKPSSSGPVFYYQVFVNDTFHANVSGLSYSYLNPVNLDKFKVRAVGVLGLKSGFSNICTYEETVSMNPWAVGIDSSVHIMWTDISGVVENLTIEGYNVYFEGVKQNSSLLTTEYTGYPKFELAIGTEYGLGVSFEYDGGQESAIFPANATPPGGVASYQVNVTGGRDFPLVANLQSRLRIQAGGWKHIGILTKRQGNVLIIPSFFPQHQVDKHDWTFPNFAEVYNKTYNMYDPFGFSYAAKLEMNRRCGEWFRKTEYNGLKRKVLDMSDGINSVKCWIRSSGGYVFTGPDCVGVTNNTSISFQIFTNEVNVERVEEASNDLSGYSLFELPQDDARLEVFDNNDTTDVVFIWTVYPSIPYYNIYIKSDGAASYPTDPHNSNLIQLNQNKYTVKGLADGTYNAKVEYVMHDKTSVIYSTNEVTFTISTPVE